MDIRYSAYQIKVEIWLTPGEASQIIEDFNKQIEPSQAGKKLYSSLSHIAKMLNPFQNEVDNSALDPVRSDAKAQVRGPFPGPVSQSETC